MNETAVEEILQKIDQLSEEDRLVLEERLAARAEREWQREADRARKWAEEQGIDQAKIDQMIHEQRYGR